MSPSLPFRLFSVVLISLLSLIASARAGGSFSQAEFLASVSDESLRRYVAEHFELSEEGRAFRVGRHLPNSGERIAPFEIVARTVHGRSDSVVLRLDSRNADRVVILPCSRSAHYDRNCL